MMSSSVSDNMSHAAAPSVMVRFDGVFKSFGRQPVLSDISFQVEKGKTAVLMGPSGCGKSTILRCINGLETVDQGRILVNGTVLTDPKLRLDWNQFRSHIGLVFQQFNLFPHLTVLQNVTLAPIKVKRMPKAEAIATAMSILSRVGLADKAQRYPDNLSGGEKQRVAIARALAMSTALLLLDEPTSALDPMMTAEVLQTIQALSDEGITLVIVTHEVDFACRVADNIIFLNEGRLEACGPPAYFLNTSENPLFVKYFHRW